MRHLKLSQSHLLTDEVDVGLNMFGATVMHRISSHVNNSNIVTIDNGCKSNWDVELLKHLL